LEQDSQFYLHTETRTNIILIYAFESKWDILDKSKEPPNIGNSHTTIVTASSPIAVNWPVLDEM
jgi:hypothetical protein